MELMIAVGILAIAASLAAPSFTSLIKETRVRAQARSLVESIELARSTAATRRGPVVVCASADGAVCANDAAAWVSGWIVVDSVDNTIVHAVPALAGGSTINAPVDAITFDAYGEIAASTQLALTPDDCTGSATRLIDVVSTGLVNVWKVAC